jgi:hypothetical protein
MSTSKQELSRDERMARLERRASVVRSRLLRAVDALDARRQQVARIGAQAKSVAVPAVLSVAGIAAVVGAGVLLLGASLFKRRRRSLSSRAAHAIQGLELVRPPSLARRVFEKVTLALVSFAATELAKRSAKNFFDGRLPDGRLAIGRALDRHRDELSAQQSMGVAR